MNLFFIFPQVGKTMSLIHKLCCPAMRNCKVFQTQPTVWRRESCLDDCSRLEALTRHTLHSWLYNLEWAPGWKTSAYCTVRCWLYMSNRPMRDSSELQDCEEQLEEKWCDAQTSIFDSDLEVDWKRHVIAAVQLKCLAYKVSCSSKYMSRNCPNSVLTISDTQIWCVIAHRFWLHFAKYSYL